MGSIYQYLGAFQNFKKEAHKQIERVYMQNIHCEKVGNFLITHTRTRTHTYLNVYEHLSKTSSFDLKDFKTYFQRVFIQLKTLLLQSFLRQEAKVKTECLFNEAKCQILK